MEFLDKLEELLLSPEFNIKCDIRVNESNQKRFNITTHNMNADDSLRIEGIKSIISYLKDPINYKNEKYDYYCLKFLSEIDGEKKWEKILELKPTEEELIHLYQYAAYNCESNHMLQFIRALNTKRSIKKIIQLGYDGQHHKKNSFSHECLREILYEWSWKKEKVLDEDYMEAVAGYIKNSKNLFETNKEIIDLCILMIRDSNKSLKFIKEILGENIPLKNKTEKTVLKVEIHPFTLMPYHRIPANGINTYLKNFEKHVSKNLDLLIDITSFTYYQNNFPENDGYYMHNFIIESKSKNSSELMEALKSYRECVVKHWEINNDDDGIEGFYKYLRENPIIFRNALLNMNLQKTCIKNEEKERKKPVKI
jgi:hypothetical protein